MLALNPRETEDESLERRKYKRFDLQVRVQFNWKDGEGVHQMGSGLTRDISTKGMFVYSESLPSHGANVQTEIFLPSPPLGNSLQMITKARAVRVQPATHGKSDTGFAVLFHRAIELRRSKFSETS
jgi:hypothetical protein